MQTEQAMSLRSHLTGLLPDVLLAALAEGPGWLVHTDGAALTWESDGAPEIGDEAVVLRWRHESGLRATQRIVRMPAYRTATVQVTLAQQDTTALTAVERHPTACAAVVRLGADLPAAADAGRWRHARVVPAVRLPGARGRAAVLNQ